MLFGFLSECVSNTIQRFATRKVKSLKWELLNKFEQIRRNKIKMHHLLLMTWQ